MVPEPHAKRVHGDRLTVKDGDDSGVRLKYTCDATHCYRVLLLSRKRCRLRAQLATTSYHNFFAVMSNDIHVMNIACVCDVPTSDMAFGFGCPLPASPEGPKQTLLEFRAAYDTGLCSGSERIRTNSASLIKTRGSQFRIYGSEPKIVWNVGDAKGEGRGEEGERRIYTSPRPTTRG